MSSVRMLRPDFTVPVSALVQTRRDGSRWAVDRFEVKGVITIPSHATHDPRDGSYEWVEAPHFFSDWCPCCVSAATCVQSVRVWAEQGSIHIVHEHDAGTN